MLRDVVIDTNVLMHAGDPRQLFQSQLAATLRALLESETRLCVAEGFQALPANNLSRIGNEYFNRLVPASVGYQFVLTLAASGRLRELPARAPDQPQTQIESLVQNVRDRTFLAVAFNSFDRVLSSDDEQDFPDDIRDAVEADLGVVVCDGYELGMRIA